MSASGHTRAMAPSTLQTSWQNRCRAVIAEFLGLPADDLAWF